ncbi:hypothetical protein EGH25_04560 [Haladaptatus sp. F3-133]|uniref:Sulfatase n=1 Tax=Halorutilus salinus TaxID=2487751 RepID=A0A9Q4C3J1_9EURY|nr:hypothetical protein [Halorutilus salinus]MCX2818623.1 hypothetical protein [Halorutilus salinus]
MQANFRDRYAEVMSETAYVTANPYTNYVDCADESNFALFDEVWRYGWDDEIGTLPPDVLTDRAIDVARNESPERLLIHYMQPHFPSLSQPELGSNVIDPEWKKDPETTVTREVWDKLKEGEIDRDTLWEAYRDNLRDVLESVETLLNNHDARKVIITADHGNGFGEEGIYAHPASRAHKVLRKVPYCITEATDEGTCTPEHKSRDTKDIEGDVEKRLADLGYLNDR